MAPRVALRKTSLVDYPGRVAAAIFFPACNLRCPWCHNGDLVLGGEDDLMPLRDALDAIGKRRSVLGGAVVTGGEPLLSPALRETVAELKALGLEVKVDTNGTLPDVLGALLEDPGVRPDYVALDLKMTPRRYAAIDARRSRPGCGRDAGEALAASAALLAASAVPHEYRTVVLPEGRFDEADVAALAPLADGSPWYFTAFVPASCLDPAWDAFPSTPADAVEKYVRYARSLGKNAALR